MHFDRLFNVLVLGGAALAITACRGDSGDKTGDGTAGSTSAGGASSGGASSGGASSGGASSGGMSSGGSSSGGAAGSVSTGGSAGEASGGSAGSGPNDCELVPKHCGCPCCWVGDCLEGEECCIQAEFGGCTP
jgi:hypothetical protein